MGIFSKTTTAGLTAAAFSLFPAVFAAPDSGASCPQGTAKNIDGNWYCSEVDSVTYSNLGKGSFSCKAPTGGVPWTGCSKDQTLPYSGALAPFNEELSVHFRGPIHLKNFASYGGDDLSSGLRRQASYDASSGNASGLTFINHHAWKGNSLSYANSQGTGSADSPQVLSDTTIPDNQEMVLMSDKRCGGNDCGWVPADSLAFHGFGGKNKAFTFEFSMPLTGNKGQNGDMPAVWLLNSRVPITEQYGSCSCWPCCGEIDLFEILSSGNKYAKSTVKSGGANHGDSHHFNRPTTDPISFVALFDDSTNKAHLKVLNSTADFGDTLSSSQIKSITQPSGKGSDFQF